MPTEQTHTDPNWKLLPGTILDGGYEMEELLEADGRRARFKIRVLGDRTIDAFASLFTAAGTAAQDQVEAWDLLRRVPHPNLAKPLAAGRRELAGVEVIYVVLKRADETLNGVLGERALTGEEASEVLLCGARALEHLGRHGLVHGSVSPEQVLAVGESIQLSAEGVRKSDAVAGSLSLKAKYVAPESTDANTTSAATIWCLGATVFETLTQEACGEGCRELAKSLPLGWVLERCLAEEPSKRCKPEEIPALVKSGPRPAIVPPVSAVAEVANLERGPAGANEGPQDTGAGGAPIAQDAGIRAAAAAATAASFSAGGATLPAVSTPAAPDGPSAKSPVPNASAARTTAFMQAEFDVLTAPQAGGASRPKPSASAAHKTSLASPAIGLPQGRTAAPLVPNAGASAERPEHAVSASATNVTGRGSYGSEAGARRNASGGIFSVEQQPEPSRLWMYVGAGVAVLLLIFFALRSKTAKTSTVNPTAATAATSNGSAVSGNAAGDASAPAANAWPTRTLEPDKAPSAAAVQKQNAQIASPSAKAEPVAASAAVWRVVVYTFNRQEDAEKRARTVNAKHPHFEAQVFSPSGHSGPYLVTVGGRMTRQDAIRFRSRAVGRGLPRDSYVQNYKP